VQNSKNGSGYITTCTITSLQINDSIFSATINASSLLAGIINVLYGNNTSIVYIKNISSNGFLYGANGSYAGGFSSLSNNANVSIVNSSFSTN
jgi:hypothetical protein